LHHSKSIFCIKVTVLKSNRLRMNVPIEVLLLTSGVGALQSVFLGVYLFTLRKGRNIANLLLAFLLLALAVRVFKSINYYFSDGHVVSTLVMNFGYGANLAIVPLLWLYLNTFLDSRYSLGWQKVCLHLAPAAAVFILSPFLTSYFWHVQYGYTFSLLLMGAYLPFCYHIIYKHFHVIPRLNQVWVLCLTTGVTVVWAGYTANFIFGLVPYITAPVIFSFAVYFMSYLGLKHSSLFQRDMKYVNSAYAAGEIEACFEKLQRTMADAQPFRDSSLTLPKLARQLAVSPNLLSEAINRKAAQNFPDFINSYRIREARILLDNPEYKNHKIAAIAFSTGFNSLSVFNAAFKKFTSTTPSRYRKQALRG
jgi:AraC-like DNA-binding protein